MEKSTLKTALGAAIAIGLAGCGGSGSSTPTSTPPPASGQLVSQTNLVSDQAGVAAWTDPNLKNPWGITFSPSGPFWVSDNTTGLATVYNSTGDIEPLVVTIPAAGGKANGPVTGQVFNSTTDFAIGGTPAAFLFDSEDGLLTGWNGGASAGIGIDRSATGAVYKGLAMGTNGGANYLYATNFNSGSIDMFSGSFKLVKSFTDPNRPAGYAPFGIANLGGLLYVTLAKQDAAKHDDVPGAGNGYVDIFKTDGTFQSRLESNGPLNSPWGLVIAPAGFGKIGGDLLVGNFGDGTVNVFNLATKASVGPLETAANTKLVIHGLWALTFGNGGSGGAANTLYFTAGPNFEADGLLGSLTASS